MLAAHLACRREEKPPPEIHAEPQPSRARLIFPESLRVADEDVNVFVRTALTQCAGGDYDAFRKLWTAKQEPISRDEFLEGWHAVDRIEVQGLQKALLEIEEGAPREPVYVLLVVVSLDPTRKAGKRDPLREIVLMIVREHEQLRIAAAPKPMRDWIKESISGAKSQVSDAPPNNP